MEIFTAFLDDPTKPVDRTCAGEIEIPFITN